jgi:hypothetical protein
MPDRRRKRGRVQSSEIVASDLSDAYIPAETSPRPQKRKKVNIAPSKAVTPAKKKIRTPRVRQVFKSDHGHELCSALW